MKSFEDICPNGQCFCRKTLSWEILMLMNGENPAHGNDIENFASWLQYNSMTTWRAAWPGYEVFHINSKM